VLFNIPGGRNDALGGKFLYLSLAVVIPEGVSDQYG
jgi:hypothetical protein